MHQSSQLVPLRSSCCAINILHVSKVWENVFSLMVGRIRQNMETREGLRTNSLVKKKQAIIWMYWLKLTALYIIHWRYGRRDASQTSIVTRFGCHCRSYLLEVTRDDLLLSLPASHWPIPSCSFQFHTSRLVQTIILKASCTMNPASKLCGLLILHTVE